MATEGKPNISFKPSWGGIVFLSMAVSEFCCGTWWFRTDRAYMHQLAGWFLFAGIGALTHSWDEHRRWKKETKGA